MNTTTSRIDSSAPVKADDPPGFGPAVETLATLSDTSIDQAAIQAALTIAALAGPRACLVTLGGEVQPIGSSLISVGGDSPEQARLTELLFGPLRNVQGDLIECSRRDFDLYRSFGHRLVFGMSLPSLRKYLAKIYEPNAPAPSRRLKTLQEAKKAGLHVYVAIAPTYPECDEQDLRATLEAVRELDPITLYHEPINIRAENVRRIEEQARSLGVSMKTDVFRTRESWADYALESLHMVEDIAQELGMSDYLHLWPDKSLGSKWMLKRVADPEEHWNWLQHWWTRISEWPSMD